MARALGEGARIISEALNGLWAGSPSETKFIPLDEVLAAQHLASGDMGELVLDNEDIQDIEENEYY